MTTAGHAAAQPTGPHHEVATPIRPAIPNSVLGKTFSILSAFDDSCSALRLVDLSQRSGVPKPSVYRLAQELVELGLLEKVDGGYRLGFGVFALSQRSGAAPRLRQVAKPVLVDLCSSTRSTVHLAMLHGDRTYYVEKLGGTHSVHVLSRVGGRLPLSCTASGKLLLALSPRSDQLMAALVDAGIERLTRHSIATPAALHREVQQIRSRRLATEHEEALAGFKSYAAPVCDPAGDTIAALSVTVPLAVTADQQLVQAVRGAASAITKRFSAELLGDDSWEGRRALSAV